MYIHGLRGSDIPVLTATGLVNGRWQFLTPTESTPLDRSPKNLLQMITSAAPTAVPNLAKIRGESLILLLILGVKYPQNHNFGDVNRRFQAKRAKY